MSKYSDDFKAEVLKSYVSDGPAEAARHHNVPKSTVQMWARKSGLHTEAVTKEMTESASAMLKRLRSDIRVDLHKALIRMVARLDQPYEDVRMVDGKPVKVTLDHPLAKESRDLTWAAAVLFDKVRLEAGEATDRTETITTDMLDREIARLERELAGETTSNED
jgi:transposase-like protein